MAPNADNLIKKSLLDAGAGILNSSDKVDELTIEAVVRAAGLNQKVFHVHFKDRPEYLRALMQHLFDETRAELFATGLSYPTPGLERAWKCVEAYLDGNLKRRGMRTLVFALAGDPIAAEMVHKRINGYAMIFKMEFGSMGVPQAAARARFYAIMTQEAAAAEYAARHALSDTREALHSFLRSL